MNKKFFPDFPDNAKLWVYPLSRPLSENERARVTERLNLFLRGWNSHDVPVRGAYHIFEDRFILVTGYVEDGVSGCSTDSMMRVMKTLREEDGIDGFDRSLVFFRDADRVLRGVTREEFTALVSADQVDNDTVVFDPTISTLADLRGGRFETTFGKAWHARAFAREMENRASLKRSR
jgi:hypothetical protein